jgi:hypothetical protein
MLQKEINIPKSFQEFHGKRTGLFSLILVYISAFSISVITLYYALPKEFPIWKTILFVILIMDIAGGVIANYTNSTNHYYQNKGNLRILFISLHAIHPILFIILFPTESTLFIFMGVYTLSSCFILNMLHVGESQRLMAVFFTVIGVSIIFAIPCDINFLRLLPILFFLKLILGFSVKHFSKIDKT